MKKKKRNKEIKKLNYTLLCTKEMEILKKFYTTLT